MGLRLSSARKTHARRWRFPAQVGVDGMHSSGAGAGAAADPSAADAGRRDARGVPESIAIPPSRRCALLGHPCDRVGRPMAGTAAKSQTLTNRRRIARDSAGRIYEERWLLVPKGSDIKSSMNFIQIADPVNTGLLNMCSIFHKRCDLSTYRPPASAAFEDEPPPPGRSKDGAHTVENLGAKNLFGLDTIGTRQTTTIPQKELWAAIARYRSCWSSGTPHGLVLTWNRFAPPPAGNEQKFTITELDMVDPDPQLFTVPEGYQVVDQQTNPPVAW